MLVVIGLSSIEHPLYQCLRQNGYHEDFLSLSEITDEEFNSLQFQYQGRIYDLNKASKSHVHVWKAFIHHEGKQGRYYDKDDMAEITHSEFVHFRREIFPVKYNGGPVPPGPDTAWMKSLKTTKAELFRKGIK